MLSCVGRELIHIPWRYLGIEANCVMSFFGDEHPQFPVILRFTEGYLITSYL